MKALLDTPVLVWWLLDSPRLSERARAILADGGSELFWSAASTWELALRASQGRLRTPGPLRTWLPAVLREQGFLPLPIHQSHALEISELPEPSAPAKARAEGFGRILAAQARVEELPLLSPHRALQALGVEVLW